MEIRKGPTIFFIIVIVVLLAVAAFTYKDWIKDQFKSKQPKSKPGASQAAVNRPTRKLDQPVQESNFDFADYNPKVTLPRRDYGRDDPFLPLVVRSQRRAAPQSNTPAAKEEEEKKTTIRLSAILGDVAIFDEDGESKSVSLGETIADLVVSDIGDGEVTLDGTEETYTIRLGKEIKVKTSESE